MTAVAQSETDAHWMREALAAARDAAQLGEVPIGTCIVVGDTVLAVAGNRTRIDNDPTAHAEMVALRTAAMPFEGRDAARELGNRQGNSVARRRTATSGAAGEKIWV